LGSINFFGDATTKVDIVRRAVLAALSRGEIGRYGNTANVLFGHFEIDYAADRVYESDFQRQGEGM